MRYIACSYLVRVFIESTFMYNLVASIDLLKQTLEHLHEPWVLDSHPWVKSCLAQNAEGEKPGEKLAQAIRQVFRETMPTVPPRRGKRLDTRWGEFGLLAAQYFAPLEFGTPTPHTQRDAWQAIDQAILLFVFGPNVNPNEEQRAAYRVVGDEPEIAPNSTISGWNRKALDALLKAIVKRENHFAAQSKYKIAPRKRIGKYLLLGALALLIGLALLLGWKAYVLLQRGTALKQDLAALERSLSAHPGIEQLGKISPQVATLRTDLDAFQLEAAPWLWLTPALGWMPVYGGDIAQASDLLQLADGLTSAADEGIHAITPAVETALQNKQALNMSAILEKLQAGEPRLLTAQVALAQALSARQRIDDGRLSDTVRNLLRERVDPLLATITGNFPIEDALTLVRAAPTALGVGKAGPQTYLLLIQNEDELRPTGGFITAVGSVVIHNGELLNIQTESVELVDDRSKPYPKPPWQLGEYMLASVLVLRDSNWFTDFPTTAQMAEYLYSYSRAHSVDGVIAIDQHVVVELLKALGPIRVDGLLYEINADNVLEYMRSAKEQHAPPGVIGIWDRKQFIGRLAQPILEKMLRARGETWSGLAQTLIRLLDERHILLQFDDPNLTGFLARRQWDGALRPPENSDFLMAVNSNIGFNKTNAVVESALAYDVDLADLNRPHAHLDVINTNHSTGDVPCEPRPPRDPAETDYPINECYFSYLRVYRPAGTTLLDSTPPAIPASETMIEVDIPAHTDDLGNEEISGAQVFGALLVVHQGESLHTGFDFGLPTLVLRQNAQTGGWTYTLTVQKQPGTIAIPLTLHIHLPQNGRLVSSSLPPRQNAQGMLTYQLKLLQDISLRVDFQIP
jgi:hypothetical protein